MLADASPMQAENTAGPVAKRRLRTLDHLDGRTTAARRAAALAKSFAAELGGQLTDVQRVAVSNAAALTAIAQDAQARRLAGDPAISLDDIVRATSAARRAVADLGLDRRKPAARLSLRERLEAEITAETEAAESADVPKDISAAEDETLTDALPNPGEGHRDEAVEIEDVAFSEEPT